MYISVKSILIILGLAGAGAGVIYGKDIIQRHMIITKANDKMAQEVIAMEGMDSRMEFECHNIGCKRVRLFTDMSSDEDAAGWVMLFAGLFKTKLTNMLDAHVPDIRNSGIEAIHVMTKDTVHIVTLDFD